MIWIEGPAGRLEALLACPAADSRTHAALFMHPHPEHGGTMHSKVVYRAARAARDLGLPTLRFNFRGVGGSEGRFDGGRGEADDARAALAHLTAAYPGRRLVVGGYSFGAWVAARIAGADPRVAALVLIGTPIRLYGRGYLEGIERPTLFVQGSEDEFGGADELEAAAGTGGGPARVTRVTRVEGAGHRFQARENEVEDAVRAFLVERLAAPAGTWQDEDRRRPR